MAKNYTLGEAVKVIADGTDIEAITDIGRRYPVLTAKVATIAGGSSKKEFVEFAQSFPDYLTANKMNKCLKEGIDETEVDDDEDDEDEAPVAKPAKKAPAKKAGRKKTAPVEDDDDEDGIDASGTDYASMNNSQLYKILGEKGERKACKEEFGKLDKKSMVAYLEKHYGDGADDEGDEDDGDESEYADMSAVELFKECKKRGLKAKPKQKQKFYIDLLEKDDAAKAEADADDDDDDEWDDEEPEEKPAKKAAPAKKAGRGRPKKQAEPEPEEDDDDDWEI